MFRKDQFGIVLNTIFAVMFGIFLTLYVDGSNMLRAAGTILWGPLLQQVSKDCIPAFALVFTIGTYIDLKAMGDWFARLCGIKNENGLLFHIVRVCSICLVMVPIMSLAMMFLAVGYVLPVDQFFIGFLMGLPMTYVVALILSFATFAFGPPLTAALCTKPPKDMGVPHP